MYITDNSLVVTFNKAVKWFLPLCFFIFLPFNALAQINEDDDDDEEEVVATSDDEIIVMDQGMILQRGRHEELIAQEGFYQDLMKSE